MTTWGALVNGRLKAGLDMSYSPAVGTGTGSVTVSWTLRGYSTYASYESGSGITDWGISGSKTQSGSMNGWNVGAGGTWVIASGSFTVNTSYTSAVTVTLNGYFISGGAYPGYKPTVSMSITIPKRPYSAPAAPTNVSAARVSDTQHTISWTRNATTGAPYDAIYVDRWDNVTNTWSTIVKLAGTATSYSNTNTVSNRQYRWRVKAGNSVTLSGYNYSGYLKTTPAPGNTPTATKDASGNIAVSWGGVSPITESQEVWHAANGVWDAAPLATVGGTATTYTHTAPNNTQTHSYRVRPKVASPALTGADSGTSNVVQLLAAPNPPSSLSPSGIAQDATGEIKFSWKHNPVDTTPQTAFEIQYRIDGGAWTSFGKVTQAGNATTKPGGTFTNGHSLEWQVRTWGSYANPSPWSASAVVTLSSPPTATVNTPDGITDVSTASLTVEWGYYDAEGTAQTAWLVTLKSGNNTIETKSGSGTDTSATLSTALQDKGTYTVTVQVTDSAGMTSVPVSQTFKVSYAKPPIPQVTAEWREEDGSVNLDVALPAPTTRTSVLTNPSFRATGAAVEARRNLCTNPGYRYAVTGSTAVIRTNYAINPSGKTVSGSGWLANDGATQTLSSDATFGRAVATSVKSTPAAGYVGKNLMSIYNAGGSLIASGANTVWTASTYVAHNSLDPVQANIYCQFLDSSNTVIRTDNINVWNDIPGGKTWTRISYTAAASPANTANVRFLVIVNKKPTAPNVNPATENAWTTDFLAELAPYVLPFFSGDSPVDPIGLTYAWSGTVNSSASTASGTYGRITAGASGYGGRLTWRTPGIAEDGTDVGTFYLGQSSNSLIVFSTDGPAANAGEYVNGRLRVRMLNADADIKLFANLFAYNAGGSGLTYVSQATTPTVIPMTGEWVDLEMPSGVLPATAAQVRFYLTLNGPTQPNALLQVSNQLLEKAAASGLRPASYFDGASDPTDSLTFSWIGTADQSASIGSGASVSGGWSPGSAPASFVKGSQYSAENDSYWAEIRKTVNSYSPVFTGAAVGKFYAARAVVAAIPGETPPGSYVQFRIHDGNGYISGSSGGIYLPDDGTPLEISSPATAPAAATGLRVYLYPGNGAPVRYTEPIVEEVAAVGAEADFFIEGTFTETDADYLRIWRQDGDKWRLVADHIQQGVTTTDRIPPLNSDVVYRAEAVSLVPSVRLGESVTVATPCKRLNRFWLNAGADFSQGVFLSPNGKVEVASSRDRTLQRFAGRERPVPYSAEGKDTSLAVKGVIVRDNENPRTATSSWDEIEDLTIEYDEPFCLRDLRGHRWFVSVNNPKWSGPHEAIQDVEFEATVIDWQEPIYGEFA